MLLLIGFAFLAGIVTVLSPCILPVLPVVLSGGVSGGKSRPWGVVTGFLFSFTVFTLTLSTLVQTLGIRPDLLRSVAAALVLAFGVVLLVPAFKDAFLAWTTRLLARPAKTVKPGARAGGFGSGFVLGLGLGVVWTPCVGPIMASVITLALSQSVDAGSVFITLAYTVGTSIPLFLIMVGGRTLLNKAPWFTQHSAAIQRVFGGLMVLTSVALFTGADRAFSTWILQVFPSYGSGLTALEDQTAVRAELDKRRVSPAPAPGPVADPLTLGKGAWINSPPLTLSGLKGKVVLVDFWTYSCVNCVRTLPYLRSWYEKYHQAGLEIVGVHSPEFTFEQEEANVRQAVRDLKVTWPVVQDNALGIWNAFQNEYWPAHYLYDRSGTLISTHFGEGAYDVTEAEIAKALGVNQVAAAVADAIPVSNGTMTPETYLGWGRGQRFASPEDVVTDKAAPYSVPKVLEPDHWALGGTWTIGKESSVSTPGAALVLRFRGARVYLVVHPMAGQPRTIRVTVDGRPAAAPDVKAGILTLDGDRLYQVVDLPGATEAEVRLVTDGAVAVYAFTFG
jgi:cytochrome c biogenesis protein CcdA/thiol-disulfide isomerase/thioredoxin